MASIKSTGAQVIITANPGCMLQLAAGVRKFGRGEKRRARHGDFRRSLPIEKNQTCIVKTAPPPLPFAAVTEPPFCSTMDSHHVSPRPEMIDLVDTRGWKILGSRSGEIPGPSSLTMISFSVRLNTNVLGARLRGIQEQIDQHTFPTPALPWK